MKKLVLPMLAVALVMAMPATPAQARVFVGVGVGGCCGYPYYPYYPYYGYGYYAPPPVVYAVPPAPPPVAYMPAPVAAAPAGAVIAADQSSPTYIDPLGRTCRQYQSGATAGKACLQADGTWRVTP